ncbi:TIGR04283 family arsenosugar biosynthesis glycosyltransferase [Oculatella sp. LEGE 06141]|uniref:TIGR04283 family arsenosugar biosynthesis glycosyltransferase n=1 Tax=Oculatella sp. LEGE 06141 TaxID=1828648 RepID=UPI0018831140|nr:TIGR04283 family arsenosugar biosynthesis glycosyltransferase [Oculatella sp. LEGE 06141]MBE9180739.1 TIGR04283 family arsenosugar biosynthesis glycosyltransferase [Oculatella sp. LEGE 06141]
MPSNPDSLSVIIPVLNEAKNIEVVLRPLQQTLGIEVIVVDGGSQDQTVDRVKALGVRLVDSLPGRARQMNAGAQVATGTVLLFLHADTRLPDQFASYVHQTLAKPGVIVGAFTLKIEGDQPGLRWVEQGVKWRSHLCQLPYGDQAIFLKAKTFHQLGGFAEMPIMEDFELVRRLRRRGRVAIAPAPVITSGRRWQRLGVWQTTVMNQIVIAAYLLGVPPSLLVRWYRSGFTGWKWVRSLWQSFQKKNEG